jgi:hypothetical protein
MDQELDFLDWGVIEVGVKIYVGKILDAEGDLNIDTHGYIAMDDAFELLVFRTNRPTQDGKTVMMQEHMHVELPLCVGGTTVRVKPSAIRYFREMNPAALQAHINFVHSAQKSFAELRALRSNIATASPADLDSLMRRNRA